MIYGNSYFLMMQIDSIAPHFYRLYLGSHPHVVAFTNHLRFISPKYALYMIQRV